MFGFAKALSGSQQIVLSGAGGSLKAVVFCFDYLSYYLLLLMTLINRSIIPIQGSVGNDLCRVVSLSVPLNSDDHPDYSSAVVFLG